MKKLTLKELILCGNLAVLGLICKPLFSPLFNLLTDFIRIPGGSATAGISILFLVFAAALIRKPAAGLLTGFVQGVCSLATGISAAAGVLVLITYSIPGMAIDLVMHIPMKMNLKTRMMLAGSGGVLSGAAATNILYYRMAWIPFLLFYLVGILSGALGGYIAWQILQRLPESLTKGFGSYEKNN
ncbi:MAG: ECF transporter S component [Solobacterium sp.]|nr:ECF transporter S component [Solobacterium sp.]